MTIIDFIHSNLSTNVNELALSRKRYHEFSDEEYRFALQQIEGYQHTSTKIPTLSNKKGWLFPPRISCEQCSSENTAKYKQSILKDLFQTHRRKMADLTGGMGVDTWFLSELFEETDYIEQNRELCDIAKNNLSLGTSKINVIHTDAESYLQNLQEKIDLFYIDPSRRDNHGNKVFKLTDCTPNITELLPLLQKYADVIMIKLSPMVDLSVIYQELGSYGDIHIVAVKDEVKEVLVILHNCHTRRILIHDTEKNVDFSFTKEEENLAQVKFCTCISSYLYEPHPAILKGGAYKLISNIYHLEKLAPNTHLYTSNEFVRHFPGRIFKVLNPHCSKRDLAAYPRANVLTRNYGISTEKLQKQLKIANGDDIYIIGATLQKTPVLIACQKMHHFCK